jgi:hypothetical protein
VGGANSNNNNITGSSLLIIVPWRFQSEKTFSVSLIQDLPWLDSIPDTDSYMKDTSSFKKDVNSFTKNSSGYTKENSSYMKDLSFATDTSQDISRDLAVLKDWEADSRHSTSCNETIHLLEGDSESRLCEADDAFSSSLQTDLGLELFQRSNSFTWSGK